MIYPCDICGADKALSVRAFKSKLQARKIFVCGNCGFVYVPERRTEQEIADAWTHQIFGDGYTSTWPLVRARLFYVAQILHDFLPGVLSPGEEGRARGGQKTQPRDFASLM
jgi:hypothetical protein